MAQCEPVRPQLIFQRWSGYAALNPRRARPAIDFQHPVKLAQIDRDSAGIIAATGRLDPTDHARTSAIRASRDALASAPFEETRDIFFVARVRDKIERIRKLAPKRAHDVGEIAAIAM